MSQKFTVFSWANIFSFRERGLILGVGKKKNNFTDITKYVFIIEEGQALMQYGCGPSSENCCHTDRWAVVGEPGKSALEQKRWPDQCLKDMVHPSLQLVMALFC